MILPVDATTGKGTSTDHTTGEQYGMFQDKAWAQLKMPTTNQGSRRPLSYVGQSGPYEARNRLPGILGTP